jgi:hypothetical protein
MHQYLLNNNTSTQLHNSMIFFASCLFLLKISTTSAVYLNQRHSLKVIDFFCLPAAFVQISPPQFEKNDSFLIIFCTTSASEERRITKKIQSTDHPHRLVIVNTQDYNRLQNTRIKFFLSNQQCSNE